MYANTLYVKKLTMNKAEVIFDEIEKAIAWESFLKEMKVKHSKVVWKMGGSLYFGFKMFRCRHQMLAMFERIWDITYN